MKTRFHVAAHALRGPITAYAKRFNLLEVRGALAATTLRRWRKSVPPHFEFATVLDVSSQLLRDPKELKRKLNEWVKSSELLRARAIVIATARDISPDPATREKLERLFDALPSDAMHRVWEPSGLWEYATARAQAKRWGVTLAVDPARESVPAGDFAYLRLRALGESRRPSRDVLARMVAEVGTRADAFVVVESEDSLDACKEIRRLAQGRTKPVGGMGRVLRPRMTPRLHVTDDEQE